MIREIYNDFSIDYTLDGRDRTFIVDEDKLFIALTDIKSKNGKIIKIMDGNQEKEFKLQELYKLEEEKIDKIFRYQKSVRETYKTTQLQLKRFLKYGAIDEELYKKSIKKLDDYKNKYKDNLEKFKQKAKKVYLMLD